MTRSVAFPFLTLPDTEINAEPWNISVNGGEVIPLSDSILDWDYATKLELSRTVSINFEGASETLGIPPSDLSLSLLVEVGTGSGRFPRRIIWMEAFNITEENQVVEIAMEPESSMLSSFLFLTVSLVLSAPPSTSKNLAPQQRNSKLWTDKFQTRLDGDEPRFPVEIASFSSFFERLPESRAPWYVSWNPGDWNRDFYGAVRLYINSEIPGLIDRIQSGDSFLMQSISVDIIDQIIEKLIIEDDAEEIISTSPFGSLGWQAGSWIRLGWPDTPIRTLREKAESQPGRFRAAIWAIAERQDEF